MNRDAPTLDLDHLKTWVGRRHVAHDIASTRQAELLRATLDLDDARHGATAELPPLWTWVYFPDPTRNRNLGADGYPAGAVFLPPIALPNRMWAGGRFVFERPIPMGSAMEKHSVVASIDHKRGQSGDLLFVTVRHEFFVAGQRCVIEEHDIVYRGTTPARKAGAPAGAPPRALHSRAWTPDSIQLFRYSALTFNSNPVHFNVDYCRQTAGYDNLLVHGPLSATMLACMSSEIATAPMKSFTYRACAPFLLGQHAVVSAQPQPQGCQSTVSLADGTVVMEATARW